MSAQMNAQPASAGQNQQAAQAERPRVETNLSYRYGSIGIEAVAAAVRYAGARKNPAYAPAIQRTLRLHESAV